MDEIEKLKDSKSTHVDDKIKRSDYNHSTTDISNTKSECKIARKEQEYIIYRSDHRQPIIHYHFNLAPSCVNYQLGECSDTLDYQDWDQYSHTSLKNIENTSLIIQAAPQTTKNTHQIEKLTHSDTFSAAKSALNAGKNLLKEQEKSLASSGASIKDAALPPEKHILENIVKNAQQGIASVLHPGDKNAVDRAKDLIKKKKADVSSTILKNIEKYNQTGVASVKAASDTAKSLLKNKEADISSKILQNVEKYSQAGVASAMSAADTAKSVIKNKEADVSSKILQNLAEVATAVSAADTAKSVIKNKEADVSSKILQNLAGVASAVSAADTAKSVIKNKEAEVSSKILQNLVGVASAVSAADTAKSVIKNKEGEVSSKSPQKVEKLTSTDILSQILQGKPVQSPQVQKPVLPTGDLSNNSPQSPVMNVPGLPPSAPSQIPVGSPDMNQPFQPSSADCNMVYPGTDQDPIISMLSRRYCSKSFDNELAKSEGGTSIFKSRRPKQEKETDEKEEFLCQLFSLILDSLQPMPDMSSSHFCSNNIIGESAPQFPWPCQKGINQLNNYFGQLMYSPTVPSFMINFPYENQVCRVHPYPGQQSYYPEQFWSHCMPPQVSLYGCQPSGSHFLRDLAYHGYDPHPVRQHWCLPMQSSRHFISPQLFSYEHQPYECLACKELFDSQQLSTQRQSSNPSFKSSKNVLLPQSNNQQPGLNHNFHSYTPQQQPFPHIEYPPTTTQLYFS